MSYRIRYGPDRIFTRSQRYDAARWLCSGVLLLLWLLSALLPDRWTELVRELLCRGPQTTTEQAVSALAEALAAGEGWYYGLVRWCAAILFEPL